MKRAKDLKERDWCYEVTEDRIIKWAVKTEREMKSFGWARPVEMISCNNGIRKVWFDLEKTQCETEIRDSGGVHDEERVIYRDTRWFTTYEEAESLFRRRLEERKLKLKKETERCLIAEESLLKGESECETRNEFW